MNNKCRTCGYVYEPWYKRIIQEVGDVITGRYYWRNRSQKLEANLLLDSMTFTFLQERNQYHKEAKALRLVVGDQHLKIQKLRTKLIDHSIDPDKE